MNMNFYKTGLFQFFRGAGIPIPGAFPSVIFRGAALIFTLFFAGASGAYSADAAETYYISPNGDGVQESLIIPFTVKDSRYIKSWHFVVTDEKGKTVFEDGRENKEIAVRPDNWRQILSNFFKSKASVEVPDRIIWAGRNSGGKTVADGIYHFYFDAADDNDNYAKSRIFRVVVDTVPPSVSLTQPGEQAKYFGADGKSAFTITQSGSREDKWTGLIKDSSGKTVRTREWYNSGPENFPWDGKDDSGFTLSEGVYSYSVSAVDAAGNRSEPAGISGIHFETRFPEFEVGRSAAQLAPYGRTKIQTFSIKTNVSDKIKSWSFAVLPDGKTDASGGEAVFEKSGTSSLPKSIDWDGIDSGKKSIAEGSFRGVLTVTLVSGAPVKPVETPSFLCGIQPDAAASVSPKLFSPDGDNDSDILTISLNVRSVLPVESWSFTIYDPVNKEPFWTKSGLSEAPAKLEWDGRGSGGELVESAMYYPWKFEVRDTQGQEALPAAGDIATDVLVIREGSRLKIRVPSIIFRANNADFVSQSEDRKRGLSQKTIDENYRILTRIAEILQKFRDYKVKVEGHANSETGTEKEEVNELVPLSEKRAAFVKSWLIAHGIDAGRLSTEGIGGRQPVMKNRKDRANWWKNRRVEFILEKR